MAKQITTLGIGAMDSLTPFITTGLEIGAAPPPAAVIIPTERIYNVAFDDRGLTIPYDDRGVAVLYDNRTFEVKRE